MFGNRGIYHEGWTACTRHSMPWVMTGTLPKFNDDVWELYAPDDWSQANNIAAQNPAEAASCSRYSCLRAPNTTSFLWTIAGWSVSTPILPGAPI